MKDKWLSYISIAAKAGKVRSGELQCEKAVQSGRAKLLILAEDASEGTVRKMKNLCDMREIPCITGPSREALGTLCGKDLRSSVAVIDTGIAKAILNKMEDGR